MSSLRIAIAGLGTVGAGTVKLLQTHKDLIAARAGRSIDLVAVAAREKSRDRGVSLSAYRWFEDPVALAADPGNDVVVEVIGGSDGIAKKVVETAIAHGKSVVTANKALLAHHGADLAKAAAAKGVTLAYEAAVAGGIPIIKLVREGLAANDVRRLYGILNGTCNYILTTMRETGRDFADVLAEAQKLGYAEADPAFDIDGVDAAHKLSILAALAFNCAVDFGSVAIEGIRHVSALDISYAEELGYRIKLLGIAERVDGKLSQRVQPCMVPADSPIASVEGVFNAVVAEGDFVGTVMAEGRGAGAGPTASAVVADLIDLARGQTLAAFGLPAEKLKPLPALPIAARRGCYFLRLMVVDRPGVIADVAAVLRDGDISMESMLQRGRSPDEPVAVVITTHETNEAAMTAALSRIGKLGAVLEPPRMIRIESF